MKLHVYTILSVLGAIPASFAQSVLLSPTATQTVTQPSGTTLTVNNLNGTAFTAKYVNGVPQVDQFDVGTGDFCQQLYDANNYAYTNHYSLVDATHFANSLTCVAADPNPFSISTATAGTTVTITDLLPAATIYIYSPWTLNYSGFILRGEGPGQTIVDYEGPTGASAVLTVGSATSAYVTQLNIISGVTFLGGGAPGAPTVGPEGNVTDGIILQTAHRWSLRMSIPGA